MEETQEGPDFRTLADRFVFALQKCCQGGQREMAARIGCTQSMISQLVSGKRKPGRALVNKLIVTFPVNANWLLTGEGEAFCSSIPLDNQQDMESKPSALLPPETASGLLQRFAESNPRSDWTLPASPWRIDPRDERSVLTGSIARFPVARVFHKASRYWLIVTSDSPLPKMREHAFLPGDLLLMETDKSFWGSLDNINGKACFASVPLMGTKEITIITGVVRLKATLEGSQLYLKTFVDDEIDEQPALKRRAKDNASSRRFHPIEPSSIDAVQVLLVRQ